MRETGLGAGWAAAPAAVEAVVMVVLVAVAVVVVVGAAVVAAVVLPLAFVDLGARERGFAVEAVEGGEAVVPAAVAVDAGLAVAVCVAGEAGFGGGAGS